MRVFLLFALAALTLGERILVLTPLGSLSHKLFYMGIAKALAERGHHVTMVSAYASSKPIDNITEVVINNFKLFSVILTKVFDDPDYVMNDLFDRFPQHCSDTLEQPQIQALKKEKFDLVYLSMFYSNCYLSFVHHFKVPLIYGSPLDMYTEAFHHMMGNINFPSIVPNRFRGIHFPQTFWERVETVLHDSKLFLHFIYHVDYKTEQICRSRGLCPPDMPSFADIRKNVSLAIINSVQELEWPPRPMLPNIIYVGGIHLRPPKSLPKDLEEWILGSKDDGFILFSLGSAFHASLLPVKYREILIKVFGSLKQRVLWKWDDDSIPGLPDNVKLGKWLPQSDILGHPKLKLFITHGGLLSTLEATYNGIPIIGMPLFADQFSNMKGVECDGWGKVSHWKTLEENSFRNLILDTMNNKSLREVAKRRSNIIRDNPMRPGDKAVYWIEYVLRHKGAPHLRSPVRLLSWYEVYNLDVYFTFLCVFMLWVYGIWSFFRFIFHHCGTQNRTKQHTE